jgi:hypothetical protein
MAKDPGIQVLIPYKDLENLLKSTSELKQLRLDLKRVQDQQSALWSRFTELMEVFSEIRKHLND